MLIWKKTNTQNINSGCYLCLPVPIQPEGNCSKYVGFTTRTLLNDLPLFFKTSDRIQNHHSRTMKDIFDLQNWFSDENLQDEINKDQRFSVTVNDHSIICPYCLDRIPEEEVISHLQQDCRKYSQNEENKIHSLKEIQNEKRKLKIRSKLQQDPLWQMTDRENHWYCPLCTNETKIIFDPSSSDENTDKVLRHLKMCQKFNGDINETQTKNEIRKQIELRNRQRNMKDKVETKMELEDERYMQSTEEGNWFCPFCLAPQPHISVETEFIMKNNAPAKIANHLISRCSPSRKGDNIHSIEEIQQALQNTSTGNTESPAPAPSGNVQLDEVREEIQKLRSQVENEEDPEAESAHVRQLEKQMLSREIPDIPSYETGFIHHSDPSSTNEFYDVVKKTPHRYGFLFAEITGGGSVDMALVANLVKKSFQIRAVEEDHPETVFQKLRKDIKPEMSGEYTVRCVYWILQTEQNRLDYINAGYVKSIVCRNEQNAVNFIDARGNTLYKKGQTQDQNPFSSLSFHLHNHDFICQCSPGYFLSSNRNPQNKPSWLKKEIISNKSLPAEELAKHLDQTYLQKQDQSNVSSSRTLLIIKNQS